MRSLLVIPARGGSKGVYLKNIKNLKGNPLIYYVIKAALECKELFDHIVVSTDSKKIKEISEYFGAEVPFLRPEEISSDVAKSEDVVLHALDYYETLEKKKYDWVLLLQPTNPLLIPEDIRGCMSMALEFQDVAKTILSVVKVHDNLPGILFKAKGFKKLVSYNKNAIRKRRQDYSDKLYQANGSIYLVNRDYLKETNSIFSEDTYYYEVSKVRYVDIDDKEDFELAEKLLD